MDPITPLPDPLPEAAELAIAGESETLEFKERWQDSILLRELAAFANTGGGTVLVGVSDEGALVGWRGGKQKLDALANKVVDSLRIHPTAFRVEHIQNVPVLRISVSHSPSPVPYQGRYFRRVGCTVREITSEELHRFLLDAMGQTWDSVRIAESTGALSEVKLRDFAKDAAQRLPYMRDGLERDALEITMRRLNLCGNGSLTRAAMLLFGKDPQGAFFEARIHMGRFKDAVTVIDDKWFGGTLFEQIQAVMMQFRHYLHVRYEIPGSNIPGDDASDTTADKPGEADGIKSLQRREIWEYPLTALREAIVNAVIHRDYSQLGCVEIRVFDDRVVVSNPGGLPESLTVEELQNDGHDSIRRNPLLAQTFYYAGLVEQWGTGTVRMAEACRSQGLPVPKFETWPNRFAVTLFNSGYSHSRLRTLGFNDRQIRIYKHAREFGPIGNMEIQELVGMSARTVLRDLKALEKAGLIRRTRLNGRLTRYEAT